MTPSTPSAGVGQIVRDAVAETFPRFAGPVTDDLSARNVPGWDSMAHVNLMFLIEERTNTTIDVAKTFGLKNVGELIRFFEESA